MKVAAIIPCRFGSTRFSGKPLTPIAGTPMIQRVYERVQQAESITHTAVATDNETIFDAVAAFGGNALMTSEQCHSGTDRVAEAANQLNLATDDIVINIQGDQPLIAPETIDATAAPLLSGIDAEMTTAAFAIVDSGEITNPKDVKVVFDNKAMALYFSRSPVPLGRDAETRFDTYKHLGIYAYTKRFLDIFTRLPYGRLEDIEKLEQLRALEYGYNIKVVVTPHDSPEVDLPADIPRIEEKLKIS
ncbi:MAG: 3-deoxy-manno-octulosonate cytidylyltransferase [Thermodesulfobacteriota bacterium]|nr:3-deoxy-manno-octulosonate cytidylyltransferase [Thermodesulfobacteriota bacterium]